MGQWSQKRRRPGFNERNKPPTYPSSLWLICTSSAEDFAHIFCMMWPRCTFTDFSAVLIFTGDLLVEHPPHNPPHYFMLAWRERPHCRRKSASLARRKRAAP